MTVIGPYAVGSLLFYINTFPLETWRLLNQGKVKRNDMGVYNTGGV